MEKLEAIAGVFDFFIPAEVLSAVLLVFTMENVFDKLFSMYVPPHMEAGMWAVVYLIGATLISGLNYVTADEDDRDDLNDDLDDL